MLSFFRSSRLAGAALVLLACIVLSGCGKGRAPRAHVAGKVEVAGKGPLTGGTISFVLISDENDVCGGAIKSDGTFDLVDVPVGDCKVVVSNSHLNTAGNKSGMPGMGGMPGMPGKGGMPGAAGPKGVEKDKMGNAPAGAVVDPKMVGEGKDTGSKYVKIDPDYGEAGKTPLRYKTVKGESLGVGFEVK